MWAPRTVISTAWPAPLRPTSLTPLRVRVLGTTARIRWRAASTAAAAPGAAATPTATAATAVLRHLQSSHRSAETMPLSEFEALCADPKTPVEAGGAMGDFFCLSFLPHLSHFSHISLISHIFLAFLRSFIRHFSPPIARQMC